MKQNLIPVPFRGTTLYIVSHEGQPFTPMKPIVEGMGLDWAAQFTKLKTNEKRFCVAEIAMQVPSDFQRRNVVCLPLRKLPGWLMSIHPNKVKPEIKDSIIAYQNECDDVLWQYWSQGTAVNPRLHTEEPTIAAQYRLYYAAQRTARSVGRERNAGSKQAMIIQLRAIHNHLGLPFPDLHIFDIPADQIQTRQMQMEIAP